MSKDALPSTLPSRSRRQWLQHAATCAVAGLSLPAGAQPVQHAQSAPTAQHDKRIPSTGEPIPALGLGTWITFNVGKDAAARRECAEVVRNFVDLGGRMIDSSPMYGSSQDVVGAGLSMLGLQGRVFAADKVWTSGDGSVQCETTRALWRLPRLDLLQVHNLLAWEKQLPLIESMKAQGRVRYVGITTSEGRRHAEMEQLMRSHPLDFVQLTYNMVDREAEDRLLPLALDRRIGVIANRPFQQGMLLRKLAKHRLPSWAGEIGCRSWAQVALKFIVSHPAITCAIPATSRVDHVRENMAALVGPWPDAALRRRIAQDVREL